MSRSAHRKEASRDGLGVLAAGDALHEDVADIPQDRARGQQHQPGKHKCADGVCHRPARVILHAHEVVTCPACKCLVCRPVCSVGTLPRGQLIEAVL